MVKTRSQQENEEMATQQVVDPMNIRHALPPRSPSEQPPLPTETSTNRNRSPAPSHHSSTNSAARLRLQLQAQERLAEISRRELRLEAELVKKRLNLELENLDDQASNASRTSVRVNEWLNQTVIHDAAVRPEDALIEPAPALLDRRGEEEQVNIQEPMDVRTNVQERDKTVRPRRSRSPTPTQAQPKTDIMQLAEVLNKMTRIRNPPRQASDLPVFTGAPNEWLPFKAAMRDSTELYHFSHSENLARLRTCLRGEARDTVSALLHTATNTDAIMKTLEQCYGRPEIIVDRALEELRRLPRLGTNVSELNSFAIKVQNTVTVLENIDRKGYLHNPLLVREVIEKLSPHLRSRWCDFAYEQRTVEDPEVIILSRFLMREADLALRYAYSAGVSTTAVTKQAAAKNTNKDGPARKTEQTRARGAAVYATSAEDGHRSETTNRGCPCCSADHAIKSCRKLRDMTTNERWEWAKSARMCFKCIQRRHRRSDCKAPVCGVNNCRRPHHPLLHTDENRPAPTTETIPAPATTSEEAVMSIAAPNQERAVLLKVCSVVITGPAGQITTHALLDEGSTVTLLDEELANTVGAAGTPAPLSLRGVNSTENQEGSRRVEITIRGLHEITSHKMTARTVRNLTLRQQGVPRDLTQYAHLREVTNACFENVTPRVLIGADNWHLIVSRQLRAGRRNEPAASLTDLGWVIYGTVPRVLHRNEDTVLHIHTAERRQELPQNDKPGIDESLHELVKEHFAVDALGVYLHTKTKPEHQQAIECFDKTARRVDNHYEVGLPWRTNNVTLPPNYNDALTRLKGIEKKMDRDPYFKEQYCQQIQNLLDKGYAEKYDGTEEDSDIQWFLPHFAVKNPNKPGKIRLVFDAAHRSQGTSLNNHLLEGPDRLQSLPGILFRFREYPIAVSADIAEMFLRIKIRKQDQPAQSFLWRGHERKNPPDRYRMTSMIFGATSSPFLAHSVRDRNAQDHASSHPRALPLITRSHYMDDLVHSFETIEEAERAVGEVIEVHAHASFTLRNWNSNSERLIDTIPEDLRAQRPTNLGHSEAQHEKTLGMLWDATNDELGFNTTLARVPELVRERERIPTKREALAAVMSIFDPLGLLSSYTITAKILLQELWRVQLQWDEPLPAEYASRFNGWLEDLNKVARLRIPRRYDNLSDKEHTRELHVFVDASERAYAAAAYWRLQYRDGRVVVTLAAAKAKVAPLRPQTIPRLELQAAVIGSRLGDTIKKEHRWNAERVTYWSDSRTVIQWIRTDARRYTSYVAHRLGEIAELTDSHQWRWVPTEHNVADDATREGHMPSGQHDRWFAGPPFLYEPENAWPQIPVPEPQDEDEEATHHTTSTGGAGALPDINRLSTYERLIRATATVLAFIDKCRKKSTRLELHHLQRAERLWIMQAQEDSFSQEITNLRAGRPLPASSRLAKLDPMIEDGQLRVRGRINAACVPTNTKRPLIMDGRHRLTRLIILKEHAAAGHASNERVLNDLRQRYWILRARPAVRIVSRTCALCIIRRATPRIPPSGDLPPARLDPYCRPFTNCGVDYFGPMTVKIGRRREKRWGALFTCLTTRAVHIEIVSSLTTSSAIMALRRMAARRGWPRQIWSDNGTNFRGADAELRTAYREWAPNLRDHAQLQRVDWRFIPPGAPNQGGAWERLVRSIKAALNATLTEQVPTEEVLNTLLLEAEYSVNARPLTHVSVDPTDPEALTPNHFLIGASNGLPRTGECNVADRRTWRAAQGLADQFWKRWIHEYLPTLVPRGSSQDRRQPLREGDLVLIIDPALPRNAWPRGVIERTHVGPDGEVRSADVRTRGGIFTRPTRKLAVLPVKE